MFLPAGPASLGGMETGPQGPHASVLELRIGDRRTTFETGRLARQANAAVLVREGDNTVLVTVVAASSPRPGADFFPLTVEYREKMAAAGRKKAAAKRKRRGK